MIILYDDGGRITQTFMFVAPSLEEYAATVLEPAGRKYLFWEGANPESKYVQEVPVFGADHFEDEEVMAAINAVHSPEEAVTLKPVVVDRPRVAIVGDVQEQVAVDQLIILSVDQPARVRVIANSQVIASETVTDGTIELSFDHPGRYDVEIGGDFPIIETIKTFEVS